MYCPLCYKVNVGTFKYSLNYNKSTQAAIKSISKEIILCWYYYIKLNCGWNNLNLGIYKLSKKQNNSNFIV